MTDLGLHRTHRAAPRCGAPVGEELSEARELRAVTDDRAGRMRLDQTHIARGDPGSCVGPFHRQHLAGLARGGHAERPAVTRACHRPDDRVDAVAVAFGVDESFQHDNGHAFPEADAVGGGVETAGPTSLRQRVNRREQQEVVDAVVRVHPAAEHQVGRAGHQLLAGGVEGGQRRRARRVHREVDPAEIEAVGDPAGDDVGEQAREGVLVQRGQAFVDLGRKCAEQTRVRGTEAVGGGEIRPGLGTEHHRRARPVERTVVVPGVAQRTGGHLQGQQLPGFDAAQRLRWDAETQRVERDRGKETTPLGRHPPAGASGGFDASGACRRLVVEIRVPAAAGHLGDRVHTSDDVGPVLVGVGGSGEHAGHPDDGHVQRSGALLVALPDGRANRSGIDAAGGGAGCQSAGRALGDLGVQGLHCGPPGPQRRNLADHEHALAALGVLVDGDQPPAVAAQPLARDPQPAEVETFQFLPRLGPSASPGEQVVAVFGEGTDELRLDAAGRVPRRGLQQHGARAVHRRLLETGQDRAGGDRFGGEQVRGAHQHPDPGSAVGQRRRGCRDHCRGPLVVHAAREQQVQPGEERGAGRLPTLGGHPLAIGQQPGDLCLPQRETRPRSHVAAALTSLEGELAGTVGEEPAEQAR